MSCFGDPRFPVRYDCYYERCHVIAACGKAKVEAIKETMESRVLPSKFGGGHAETGTWRADQIEVFRSENEGKSPLEEWLSFI